MFLDYVRAYTALSTTGNADSFISGFRLGTRFTYDALMHATDKAL